MTLSIKVKENKLIKISLIVMMIVMFLIIMGVKKAQSDLPSLAKEIVLNVIPLKTEKTEVITSHIGYVTPIRSVNLVSNVSGYIQDVLVEGGQEVKKGDVLVVIDQREYEAALKAAKATTAKAQADLNNADVYYKRVKKAGSKAVSATELDNAKAGYLSAIAALEEARANQNKAQVVYDYTVLQSTIDGVVGNVDLTAGNYVAPGNTSLLSIIQTNPIRVVFSISDKEYLDVLNRNADNKLFYNDKIKIRLVNGDMYNFEGEYKFIDNSIDKSTGSIAVYADFANPNGDLVSGGYVTILVSRQINNGIWVEQNHVYLTPKGAYIYIIDDSKLVKKFVKIISEKDGKYLLEENFGEKQYLVVNKVGEIGADTKIRTNIISAEEA